MKDITYRNPVLPGFYPDPSICRAGDDYYMVNSSFEFFPGVPIHHSKDLVHWKTIGHCISRSSQLKLPTGVQSCSGIFAPTIRYHQGRFYMITTNVVQTGENSEHGNFYMYTENPAGDWSDPVFLGTPGIDPSLFLDEDETSWYVGTAENQIYLQKIDLQKGAMEGESHILWKGSGGSYPEGPHLYRKGDWYYLMISEGGTERCHMLTIARSKNIFGPYEECPSNPVMTNRSLGLPIESAGHGDLIEDTKGNWWAVCLGTRNFGYPPCHNLGRETMLVPVDFSGDWPIFGDEGKVLTEFKVRELPGENAGEDPVDSFEDHFRSSVLHPSWNFIYNPDPSLFQTGKGALILRGNAHALEDAVPLAWVGRRQQHHECRSEVTLSFQCSGEGEEAGLTVFTNNRHHYEAALTYTNGERKLIFRRQIGSLWKIEKEIPWIEESVTLWVEGDLEFYRFYYKDSSGNSAELGRGETRYLTTEVGGAFTGNYIGLYSVGNGRPCEHEAVFRRYRYCQK